MYLEHSMMRLEAYHGASKIDSDILINNYGSGAVCGGAVISKGADVFRSFNGGLSKMDTELNLSDDILGILLSGKFIMLS